MHPLDNGLIDWRRLSPGCARARAVADRVVALEGGIPLDLLRHAAGVVTVNSTAGITALCLGVPTKVLGSAVYDVAGPHLPGPARRFLARRRRRPTRTLLPPFLRALIGTTQIRGGFHKRVAGLAIAGLVQRLERRALSAAAAFRRRAGGAAPRAATRTIVVTGAGADGGSASRWRAPMPSRGCGCAWSATATRRWRNRRRLPSARRPGRDVPGRSDAASLAQIAAFELRSTGYAPIDLLVAHGDRRPRTDIAVRDATDGGLPTACGARARRDRRGQRPGRPGRVVGEPAHGAGQAGLCSPMRRALRRTGWRGAAGVSIARAGRLAGRIAARGGDPRLVAVSADRAAAAHPPRHRQGHARDRVSRRSTIGLRARSADPACACAMARSDELLPSGPPNELPMPVGRGISARRAKITRRATAALSMLARIGRAAMVPLWAAQLATATKSFERNGLIGSRRLNERGLHAARVALAHRIARARRRRLAGFVSAADRSDFARDGFVVSRDFLPAVDFAALVGQVEAYRGGLREIAEGDTVLRKIALDPRDACRRCRRWQHVLRSPVWRGLIRYVGSRDAEPVVWIQAILRHAGDGPPDPQTALHADTFHPTVKAWLFLTDIAEDAGPFTYVPGSHRLTPERLAWEREMSLAAPRFAQRRRPARARSASDRATSPRSACRRRASSRCRPTRSSSPTRSAFTPAAPAPAARCGSKSGPMGGAARSCRGAALDPWTATGLARRSLAGWRLGDLLDAGRRQAASAGGRDRSFRFRPCLMRTNGDVCPGIPAQYLKFAGPRLRPAIDLLSASTRDGADARSTTSAPAPATSPGLSPSAGRRRVSSASTARPRCWPRRPTELPRHRMAAGRSRNLAARRGRPM